MFGSAVRAPVKNETTKLEDTQRQELEKKGTTRIKKEPPTPLSRILTALARLIEEGPPPSPVPINENRRIRPRNTYSDDCQVGFNSFFLFNNIVFYLNKYFF